MTKLFVKLSLIALLAFIGVSFTPGESVRSQEGEGRPALCFASLSDNQLGPAQPCPADLNTPEFFDRCFTVVAGIVPVPGGETPKPIEVACPEDPGEGGDSEVIDPSVDPATDEEVEAHQASAGKGNIDPDIEKCKTTETLAQNCIILRLSGIINILAAGVAAVVALTIIASGIQYALAGGNPQTIAKARNRIFIALLGLVIYILFYALMQWIIPGGVAF